MNIFRKKNYTYLQSNLICTLNYILKFAKCVLINFILILKLTSINKDEIIHKSEEQQIR